MVRQVQIPGIGSAGVILAWAAWDLYGPRSHDLRDFQPDEVGRVETAMWRSYYDRANLPLFSQLALLLRRQYHLPPLRSYVTAYHAARAATVFQAGHGRSDYEKALPHLVSFYSAIAGASGQHFDVHRTARLELEWWIAHRERALHPREDLDHSLAELQAELYHLPAARFADHAILRADAMLLRDVRAEALAARQPAAERHTSLQRPAPRESAAAEVSGDRGKLGETDWAEIERQLCASWRSLWNAVNPTSEPPATGQSPAER